MRSAFFFSRAAFFSLFDIFLAGVVASGFQRFSCLLTGGAILSSHLLYLAVSLVTTFGCFFARFVVSLRSFLRSKSSIRFFSATSFQFPLRMAHFPFSPAELHYNSSWSLSVSPLRAGRMLLPSRGLSFGMGSPAASRAVANKSIDHMGTSHFFPPSS